VDLLGAGGLGEAPSDAEVVPLVRVNPQYPERARQRGVEGWVLVEFTVTKAGTVKDAVVIDADPKNYFERAARKAVLRYKYKPKVENGVAVDRPGVRVLVSFKLED
jgi:protein TonB